MPELNRSSMQELEDVVSNYDWSLDEPESLRLVAKLREVGVLTDEDWTQILGRNLPDQSEFGP